MKKLALLVSVILLCACGGPTVGDLRRSFYATQGEMGAVAMAEQAVDRATCQSYGEQPGSDAFATCMAGLARARAARNAGTAVESAAR